MANFGIKPSRTSSGFLVVGQTITVSSSSATAFASTNAVTQICVVQFRGGDVYATFDGQTSPGPTSFQVYNNTAHHWDVNTTKAAQFIGVSSSVTAALQEFQINLGDSQLPDTSLLHSYSAP